MTRWRGVLILICLTTTFVAGQGAMEALIGTDPAIAATVAFRNGDRRHIILPICNGGGEVIAGWLDKDQAQAQKAIENGWRPITCADIGDDPKLHKFIRLIAYAEKYNRQMYELDSRGKK